MIFISASRHSRFSISVGDVSWPYKSTSPSLLPNPGAIFFPSMHILYALLTELAATKSMFDSYHPWFTTVYPSVALFLSQLICVWTDKVYTSHFWYKLLFISHIAVGELPQTFVSSHEAYEFWMKWLQPKCPELFHVTRKYHCMDIPYFVEPDIRKQLNSYIFWDRNCLHEPGGRKLSILLIYFVH